MFTYMDTYAILCKRKLHKPTMNITKRYYWINIANYWTASTNHWLCFFCHSQHSETRSESLSHKLISLLQGRQLRCICETPVLLFEFICLLIKGHKIPGLNETTWVRVSTIIQLNELTDIGWVYIRTHTHWGFCLLMIYFLLSNLS